MTEQRPTCTWDEDGVTVRMKSSESGQFTPQRLSHAEVATLTNYDASALGLPLMMEAVVVVAIEGRIDLPHFIVRRSIEPFSQMHPWLVYRRAGALLFVGERMWRLNMPQLRVLEALDTMDAAGNHVGRRLAAWPVLSDALKGAGKHHVLLQGDLPNLRVHTVKHFPPHALTRRKARLESVRLEDAADWAMCSGRHYYLKEQH